MLECPLCDGVGCSECDDGQWKLTSCAREFVSDITRAVNMAGLADKHLPQTGGLMDQSQWFINLWIALQNDQFKIDEERMKRE